MCDTSFQEYFRMSKAVFERLVDAIYAHLLERGKIKRNRTPFNRCAMMGIWPLFNQDTFRSSALHFVQKKMGIHYHYQYIIEALRNMAPDYIKWPNEYEREIIKAHFEEKCGFVGVVGCMDGVSINITAPLEQPQRYVNRHHSYSILVQAVCIGDSRNFDRSPLSKNLLTCPELLSDGEHIIADGAYTLTDKVLVPYTNDGNLSRRQRTHNYLLSASRSRVENSFALLRGKRAKSPLFGNLVYKIFVIWAPLGIQDGGAVPCGLPSTKVRGVNHPHGMVNKNT
ncbi:Protein ANTAGONIST OF LIKE HETEROCHROMATIN PROTEIN 1 [Frankliniella fusca]|uniref:Protein ANTAGONIST OF LIKE HETEROCHROMATIN PROTEIN 1 n=1 Tax=Frankliniella fusca TaxID=407009 RepID=A0AAE1HHS9_9NEOP|nr:Protein ANTAGONIST OF LIKE HETEROCHROMATIN PROTEIN 1 [Frankliniella fusca]